MKIAFQSPLNFTEVPPPLLHNTTHCDWGGQEQRCQHIGGIFICTVD
jgi:hypothetical protein